MALAHCLGNAGVIDVDNSLADFRIRSYLYKQIAVP